MKLDGMYITTFTICCW